MEQNESYDWDESLEKTANELVESNKKFDSLFEKLQTATKNLDQEEEVKKKETAH